MKSKILFLVMILLIAANLLIGEEQTQSKVPTEFSGNVVDAGGAVPRISSTFFNMKIEKYTSDEEVMRFAKILAEKGQDALVDELDKVENGRLKIGNQLANPIGITRIIQKDGKRVVRAVTNRPVSMIEAWRNPRSMDYPFGLVEIVLDADGKGEGKLLAATKVQFKDGVLEIENYGTEPFRILNIKSK